MKQDRDIEISYSLPEFVAELRRLADALEAGTQFGIDLDGEEVLIPQDAIFSIEHEREDGQEEIEFQLSWATGADEDDEDDFDDESEDDEPEEDEDAVEAELEEVETASKPA